MTLKPIYRLVGEVDGKKEEACQEALIDIIGKKKVEAPKDPPKPETPAPTKTATVASSSSTASSTSGCFPEDAQITTRNQGPKKMADLAVGDEVLCFNPKKNKVVFAKVFMFSHRVTDLGTNYLTLTCSNGMAITLTGQHLIKVNGEFKYAKHVEVGDQLVTFTDGQAEEFEVIRIQQVYKKGLYSPYTMEGTIIVDGIGASCYCDIAPGILGISHQSMAHSIHSPLRGLNRMRIGKSLMEIPEGDDMPSVIKFFVDNILHLEYNTY